MLAPGEAYFSTTVTTDGNGNFSRSGALAGRYTYCAELEGYLNPCDWAKPLGVEVQPAAAAALPVLVLRRGAVVSVRVVDPGRVKPRYDLVSPGIALGVFQASGRYRGARLVSQTPGVAEFRITVPLDEAVDLWVHSPRYRIEDEARVVIPERGRRESLPRGLPVVRTLVITGVR
jgi:hypothetical protein